MTYQGHKNWNHWSVALWLFNEYDLYLLMQSAISNTTTRDNAGSIRSRISAGSSPTVFTRSVSSRGSSSTLVLVDLAG